MYVKISTKCALIFTFSSVIHFDQSLMSRSVSQILFEHGSYVKFSFFIHPSQNTSFKYLPSWSIQECCLYKHKFPREGEVSISQPPPPAHYTLPLGVCLHALLGVGGGRAWKGGGGI